MEAEASATYNGNDNGEELWNLGIRTVSALSDIEDFQIECSSHTTLAEFANLVIQNSPSRDLTTSRVRLIYLGRVIYDGSSPASSASTPSSSPDMNSDSLKLMEVDGLSCGQTIHLVPRPPQSASNANFEENSLSTSNGRTANARNNTSTFSLDLPSGLFMSTTGSEGDILDMLTVGAAFEGGGGTERASNLFFNLVLGAATISSGMGTGVVDNNSNNGSNNGGGRMRTQFGIVRTTSARNGSNDDEDDDVDMNRAGTAISAIRRESVRAGDDITGNNTNWQRRSIRVPSTSMTNASDFSNNRLEPIRQNLMTVNTLLDAAARQQYLLRSSNSPTETHSTSSSVRTGRFFVGQWVDCRDTVNQWLEATILDVSTVREVLDSVPEDIDSSAENNDTIRSSSAFRREHSEAPLIRGTDLIGRRRLLRENDASEDTSTLQFLLIHYNGWPSDTWNEWIRSDSDRIRPFRSRTIHNQNLRSSSTPNFHSPTTDIHVQNAPSTRVVNDSDILADEQRALVPQISQTLEAITSLIDTTLQPSMGTENNTLPWIHGTTPTDLHLGQLAPLLDRVGRALIDVAPHVRALGENHIRSEEHLDSVPIQPLFESSTDISSAGNVFGGDAMVNTGDYNAIDYIQAEVEEQQEERASNEHHFSSNGNINEDEDEDDELYNDDFREPPLGDLQDRDGESVTSMPPLIPNENVASSSNSNDSNHEEANDPAIDSASASSLPHFVVHNSEISDDSADGEIPFDLMNSDSVSNLTGLGEVHNDDIQEDNLTPLLHDYSSSNNEGVPSCEDALRHGDDTSTHVVETSELSGRYVNDNAHDYDSDNDSDYLTDPDEDYADDDNLSGDLSNESHSCRLVECHENLPSVDDENPNLSNYGSHLLPSSNDDEDANRHTVTHRNDNETVNDDSKLAHLDSFGADDLQGTDDDRIDCNSSISSVDTTEIKTVKADAIEEATGEELIGSQEDVQRRGNEDQTIAGSNSRSWANLFRFGS